METMAFSPETLTRDGVMQVLGDLGSMTHTLGQRGSGMQAPCPKDAFIIPLCDRQCSFAEYESKRAECWELVLRRWERQLGCEIVEIVDGT